MSSFFYEYSKLSIKRVSFCCNGSYVLQSLYTVLGHDYKFIIVVILIIFFLRQMEDAAVYEFWLKLWVIYTVKKS